MNIWACQVLIKRCGFMFLIMVCRSQTKAIISEPNKSFAIHNYYVLGAGQRAGELIESLIMMRTYFKILYQLRRQSPKLSCRDKFRTEVITFRKFSITYVYYRGSDNPRYVAARKP